MITKEQNESIWAFLDYLITDELGDWTGIRDDAPVKAKKAYEQFMAAQKEAHDKGVRL